PPSQTLSPAVLPVVALEAHTTTVLSHSRLPSFNLSLNCPHHSAFPSSPSFSMQDPASSTSTILSALSLLNPQSTHLHGAPSISISISPFPSASLSDSHILGCPQISLLIPVPDTTKSSTSI